MFPGIFHQECTENCHLMYSVSVVQCMMNDVML